MAIKRIKVSNFKSFKELDTGLGNFNVLIGANASGKSNFTQIFKFLRSIESNNLKNALSIHGGLNYICNLKAGTSESLKIGIFWDKKFSLETKKYRFDSHDLVYEFSLRRDETKSGFKILFDQLIQEIDLLGISEKNGSLFEDSEIPKKGSVNVIKDKNKIRLSFEPVELEAHFKKVKHPVFTLTERPDEFPSSPNALLIQEPYLYFIVPPWLTFLKNTAIYDFDPHKAKNPAKITGIAELEEDGSNLAIILNNIIEDDDSKRKLCNLVKDILPFVSEVGTEKFAEKSLMITLQEDYYKDKDLRADLLSDGTVNITALIVALYFEEKELIIIEEPERNIHPHLISRLVQMMKEASKKKQIIITTHSPEFVKHAELENLLLVSRDKDGFSKITRPKEEEQVKVFLDNEMGLDELYIQDLLTVE